MLHQQKLLQNILGCTSEVGDWQVLEVLLLVCKENMISPCKSAEAVFMNTVARISWLKVSTNWNRVLQIRKCEGNGRCWKEDSDRGNKGTCKPMNSPSWPMTCSTSSWIESHVATEHLFADLSLDARCFRPHVKAARFVRWASRALRKYVEVGMELAHPVRHWNLGKMNDASYASSMQAVYQRMQKAVWFTPFLQCRRKLQKTIYDYMSFRRGRYANEDQFDD